MSSRRWYRIDTGNGQITEATSDYVRHAAMNAFVPPSRAFAAGRFRTQHAIYSTGDQITVTEHAAGEAYRRRVGEPEIHARKVG